MRIEEEIGMVSDPHVASVASASSPPRQSRGLVFVFFGLAVVILLAGWNGYRVVKEFEWLRVNGLVAMLVSGVGVVSCFAGIMHLVDRFLAAKARAWYVRWGCFHLKQVLLVGQILGMGVAVGVGLVLLFGFKVP